MKYAKWVVVTSALLLLTFVGTETGALVKMLEMDSTHLTVVILSVFVLAHFAILHLCSNYDEHLEDKLWYVAETLVSLGMIGTVIGFTMLFGDAFMTLDVEDPSSIAEVITDMALGMGTALITTLAGLVSSLVLKGELVFIGREHG